MIKTKWEKETGTKISDSHWKEGWESVHQCFDNQRGCLEFVDEIWHLDIDFYFRLNIDIPLMFFSGLLLNVVKSCCLF